MILPKKKQIPSKEFLGRTGRPDFQGILEVTFPCVYSVTNAFIRQSTVNSTIFPLKLKCSRLIIFFQFLNCPLKAHCVFSLLSRTFSSQDFPGTHFCSQDNIPFSCHNGGLPRPCGLLTLCKVNFTTPLVLLPPKIASPVYY